MASLCINRLSNIDLHIIKILTIEMHLHSTIKHTYHRIQIKWHYITDNLWK